MRLKFDRPGHPAGAGQRHSRAAASRSGGSSTVRATDRVRLGPLACGNTYRNPDVLAKQAVTADYISNGRMALGLGAGWQDNEHRAHGIEFCCARRALRAPRLGPGRDRAVVGGAVVPRRAGGSSAVIEQRGDVEGHLVHHFPPGHPQAVHEQPGSTSQSSLIQAVRNRGGLGLCHVVTPRDRISPEQLEVAGDLGGKALAAQCGHATEVTFCMHG
ncbi:MAG: LLM class flavin-dependent oxidoreductase [Candidatus Microthrix sp.]|nr:LLM class flavin-dependent oxidoreductase [Candidatus Microthrix sp.]